MGKARERGTDRDPGVWAAIGSPDDFNKLWRDTGLYDGNGNARPALSSWKTQAAFFRR